MAGGDASLLLEQLSKAFMDLQALRDASSGERVQWKEIVEHFCNVDASFKEKFLEIEAKEKEFEMKEAEARSLIAERKVAVAAKEQAMLDGVQELKDVAVAAVSAFVSNSGGQHRLNPEPINDGEDREKCDKVSSYINDKNSMGHLEDFQKGPAENPQGVPNNVQPRLELVQFCQQMDSAGLLRFALENQDILDNLRLELSDALESATEPARLVLELLVAVYLTDETDLSETSQVGSALEGMYKSCVIILEALAAFLARTDAGHILNSETKQEAKEIAHEWILMLKGAKETANESNSLRAAALLQLLATFRVASEVNREGLCKLVLAVAHNRQTPELCRSLGLTEKMPVIIQQLLNSGRQVDAVHCIHAFKLTESFPPVPLLKRFLKDLRRNFQRKVAASDVASSSQMDVNARELAALRAVIGCVNEFNLESQYKIDCLQKRLKQLEKARPDKKRVMAGGGGDLSRRSRNRPSKKSRSKAGGAPTSPAIAQRAPLRHPNTIPHNHLISAQPQYAQQGYDQISYYHHSQGHQLASTSFDPAALPNYRNCNPNILQSCKPYM